MTKYPEGPWTATPVLTYAGIEQVLIRAPKVEGIHDPHLVIARVLSMKNYNMIDVANLMAAAPQLLEALEAAEHMLCRDFIDPDKMAVIDKCAEAIKQAKGE